MHSFHRRGLRLTYASRRGIETNVGGRLHRLPLRSVAYFSLGFDMTQCESRGGKGETVVKV